MLWDHVTSSVIFFELPCHFSKTPLKRNKLFCFGKDEPSVRGQQAQNLRGNRQLRKRKIGKTNQRKIDYEAHDQLHVASHFGSFHFFFYNVGNLAVLFRIVNYLLRFNQDCKTVSASIPLVVACFFFGFISPHGFDFLEFRYGTPH